VEPDSRFVIAIPGGLKFSPNLPMQPRRREALLDPRIYAAPTRPDLAPDSNSGDEGVDCGLSSPAKGSGGGTSAR